VYNAFQHFLSAAPLKVSAKTWEAPTVANVTILQLLDPLKVFVEYDTQYDVYVAQCLQTGHLVTADDPESTKDMIEELLQEEITLAVERGDISKLLSHPASIDVWLKWEMAYKTSHEERKITVRAEFPQQLRLLVGQRAEVETEIRIATGKAAGAA
jgi:hypothetical protein